MSLPFFLSILGCDEPAANYLDLAWDANQEEDLAGYRVYYGTSAGEYINFIDVGDVTTFHLDDLIDGVTYFIALTAYDRAGNESDFSEEASGAPLLDALRN
jgi:fibronectin type 3 domain-containing protein